MDFESCCWRGRGTTVDAVTSRFGLYSVLSVRRVGGIASTASLHKNVPLERVLARKTFITVVAGERLHRKMNPFMPLQVMIAIEALRTLVTFEGPVICGLLLRGICSLLAVHGGGIRGIAAIESHR